MQMTKARSMKYANIPFMFLEVLLSIFPLSARVLHFSNPYALTLIKEIFAFFA
jgi:hypothetical protein